MQSARGMEIEAGEAEVSFDIALGFRSPAIRIIIVAGSNGGGAVRQFANVSEVITGVEQSVDLDLGSDWGAIKVEIGDTNTFGIEVFNNSASGWPVRAVSFLAQF